jgi:hypothetical protein
VNDTKLTTSFAEIFDFLDLTKTFQITFKGAGGEDLVREVDAEVTFLSFIYLFFLSKFIIIIFFSCVVTLRELSARKN